MEPGASIIIVTYNSATTIKECLTSVARTLRPQDEVIVIDNNSLDETVAILERLLPLLPGKLRLLPQSENTGFSRGCNIGIEHSCKEHIILLNPDTTVHGDWIANMTDHFRFYPKTGAVGPLSDHCMARQHISTYVLSYDEHKLLSEEIRLILKQVFTKKSVPMRLLMGFCLALPRALLDRYGALDEDIFLGDDDLEISWRLREKGYLLRLALDVFVHHQNHVSFASLPGQHENKLIVEGSDVLFEKMRRYYAPAKIPDPRDYFGIDWWRPSILKSSPPEEVFDTDLLPCDYDDIIPATQRLVEAGRLSDAIEHIERALRVAIQDPSFWLTAGILYEKKQRDLDAELAFKNAWALQLQFGTGGKKLAQLLQRQGRVEEIVSLLNAADGAMQFVPAETPPR